MLKYLGFAGLALAAVMAAPAAFAQTDPGVGETDWETPANLPPDGFTGVQYVDNRGCVFVRAGVDGATEWVPRVTRSREQVCGQTPTFRTTVVQNGNGQGGQGGTLSGGGAAPQTQQAQTAQAPAPAETPTTTASPAQARQTQQAQQAAALRAEAEERARADLRNGVPAAAPQQQARAQRATSTTPHVVRRFPGSQSSFASATLHQPRQWHHGSPSAVAPAPAAKVHRVQAKGSATASQGLGPDTWIVPRHVWEARKAEGSVKIPYGYRPVWEDDRLNPYRAYQRVRGYHATQQLWTNTVPREIVPLSDRPVDRTGPNVTGRVSGHVPHGYRRIGHPMYD